MSEPVGAVAASYSTPYGTAVPAPVAASSLCTAGFALHTICTAAKPSNSPVPAAADRYKLVAVLLLLQLLQPLLVLQLAGLRTMSTPSWSFHCMAATARASSEVSVEHSSVHSKHCVSNCILTTCATLRCLRLDNTVRAVTQFHNTNVSLQLLADASRSANYSLAHTAVTCKAISKCAYQKT
jgi:hypothetical protein